MFPLVAGESRDVVINLVMNAGKATQDLLPDGSALAGVANAFQQLQPVTDALDSNSYEYHLEAVADVEGVSLDPSQRQNIQILKPISNGWLV